MKIFKNKKFILMLAQFLLIATLLVTGTYAFFHESQRTSVDNSQFNVEAIDLVRIKKYEDYDYVSQTINFPIPEGFEMMTLTTIDGYRFYFENGDEYFWGDEPIYGYIYEDFTFFAVRDLDVYIGNDDVFTTEEVELRADIVESLRMSFTPFYEEDDGEGGVIRTYGETVIYAKNDTETIVEQVTGEEVIVESFTEVGVLGGNPVFSLQTDIPLNVRIAIWLEGNDEQADVRLVHTIFSVKLRLFGERVN